VYVLLPCFENRVLRRIFEPKRDGLTGEWRKLHNKELNEMGWGCGTYGGRESCAQGIGGETRGKETIGESKA
jgi:hypothetical protein